MGDEELFLVNSGDFDEALSKGLLVPERRNELEAFLRARSKEREATSGSTFSVIAYYLGTLVVLAALTWFVADAWESMGGWGLASVAAVYGGLFVLAGRHFYGRQETRVLGGLLFSLALCLTPLFSYGVQKATGLWTGTPPGEYDSLLHWARSGWCVMELSTIAAALAAIRLVRFSFLAAPLSMALWYLTMDLSSLLNGDHRTTSLFFGLILMVLALLWDLRRKKEDPEYGFWLHLVGAVAFWGGLSLLDGRTELRRFLYGAINLGLIVLSTALDRSIYLILGGLGFFGYLGHLAWSVFEDVLYFPLVLVLFGLAVMACGLWYHRRRKALSLWIEAHLPPFLLRLREVRGDSAWK